MIANKPCIKGLKTQFMKDNSTICYSSNTNIFAKVQLWNHDVLSSSLISHYMVYLSIRSLVTNVRLCNSKIRIHISQNAHEMQHLFLFILICLTQNIFYNIIIFQFPLNYHILSCPLNQKNDGDSPFGLHREIRNISLYKHVWIIFHIFHIFSYAI